MVTIVNKIPPHNVSNKTIRPDQFLMTALFVNSYTAYTNNPNKKESKRPLLSFKIK